MVYLRILPDSLLFLCLISCLFIFNFSRICPLSPAFIFSPSECINVTLLKLYFGAFAPWPIYGVPLTLVSLPFNSSCTSMPGEFPFSIFQMANLHSRNIFVNPTNLSSYLPSLSDRQCFVLTPPGVCQTFLPTFLPEITAHPNLCLNLPSECCSSPSPPEGLHLWLLQVCEPWQSPLLPCTSTATFYYSLSWKTKVHLFHKTMTVTSRQRPYLGALFLVQSLAQTWNSVFVE